jgi:translation initiation factor 3 subunit I
LSRYEEKLIFVYDLQKVIDLMIHKHTIKENNAESSVVFKGHSITQVKYSYLNEKIYVCTEGGTLHIYTDDLKFVETKKIYNGIPINSLTFSEKYDFMLVSSDNGAKILHPDTFETITDLRSDYPVYCAQFSPLMYNEKNPKFHVIMGGGARARDTAFMRSGGLEIYIMNAIHGNVLSRLGGHYGPINWIHVFGDGTGIITAGEESIVRIYRFDKKYLSDPQFSHTNNIA